MNWMLRSHLIKEISMSQKNKIPQEKPEQSVKKTPEKAVVLPEKKKVKRFMSVTERLQMPLHPHAL